MKPAFFVALLIIILTSTVPLLAQSNPGAVYNMVWSPDGTLIATGGEGFVRVWSSATQVLLLDLPLNDEIVSRLIWSPDSTKFAAVTDQLLQVWTISLSGTKAISKIYSEFPLTHFFPTDAAWSPNGQFIAVSGFDTILLSGRTLIWDVATRQILGDRNRLVGEQTVMWTPDSESLVIGQHDEGPFIIAAFDTVIKHTDPNPERTAPIPAYFFAWSPDGNQITIGYTDGIIVVRDLAASTQVSYLDTHTNSPIANLVWTPDNRVFAIVATADSRQIWDVNMGQLRRSIPAEGPLYVRLSPDGRELAIASTATAIEVQPALVSP